MQLNQTTILRFWRYLLLAFSSALIIFVLTKAIVTGRTLVYKLDFRQTIGPDITGWYPEQRTEFAEDSLLVLAEPLYMKVYTPIDFDRLSIEGDLFPVEQTIRLGLKQSDGAWHYEEIRTEHFRLDFDLRQAQIKRNQLEFILSAPDLATSTINLKNNWRLTLER